MFPKKSRQWQPQPYYQDDNERSINFFATTFICYYKINNFFFVLIKDFFICHLRNDKPKWNKVKLVRI
jgi:hypothetical protein